MPDEPEHDDLSTTGVMSNLFDTLRRYSTTPRTTETELLRRRAGQYASIPRQQSQTATDTLTVITFRLGEETYGLNVDTVRGVRPLPQITRVPNAPAFFRGVINVRGAVVTLLDLRMLFGMGQTINADEIIVTEAHDITLAIPVQRVQDVLTIPRNDITGLEDVRYALGAYVTERERIIVIHADELFGDKRLTEAES
ncbi:MAG: chemotaxis protein CheW [Chloroflexota bacterium]